MTRQNLGEFEQMVLLAIAHLQEGAYGIAIAVALGAGAYAVINSYFYPDIPLQVRNRIVAIGKLDARRHAEDERLLHDFAVWRRELHSVVGVGVMPEGLSFPVNHD